MFPCIARSQHKVPGEVSVNQKRMLECRGAKGMEPFMEGHGWPIPAIRGLEPRASRVDWGAALGLAPSRPSFHWAGQESPHEAGDPRARAWREESDGQGGKRVSQLRGQPMVGSGEPGRRVRSGEQEARPKRWC